MSARFVFAATQAGSERPLKNEIAREHPELRFAFSRPGFVTFRSTDEVAGDFVLRSVFARTWGHSLGKVSGPDDTQLARDVWRLVGEQPPRQAFAHLHVWQRERPLPGDEGYDGTADELARTIGASIVGQTPESVERPIVNTTAADRELVLDCVLVERDEWWVGWHRAASPETRWPGGVPPLVAPKRMISRAYLKILEALLWSGLPLAEGDRCIEIGCAPGGSCLALLERGCVVTGIDPAEMDPLVLIQPNFTHLRARAKEVKRSVFRDCRWLIMDANVAPNYTLDTIEGLLTTPRVRPEGLLLTLKLTDPKLAANLSVFEKRIRSWGYRSVRLRQLTFNRQEVCAVVTDGSTH